MTRDRTHHFGDDCPGGHHDQEPPRPWIYEQATTYTLSMIPEDHIDHMTWSISVEHRGRGKWAVCRHGRTATRTAAGIEWEHEPIPSSREDDYLTTHRHDLAEALAIAREALPGLTVNGLTSVDVLARMQERERQP